MFSSSFITGAGCLVAFVMYLTLAERSPAQEDVVVRPIEGQMACAVAISPEGRTFAVTQAGRIVFYEAATGKVLRRYVPGFERLARTNEPYALVSLDFSRDGTLLAAGRIDGAICLWKSGAEGEPATLKISPSGYTVVHCVRFSPDATLVAGAGCDENVWLWDVKQRKVKATMPGSARCVTFSGDGKLLATGSTDDRVAIWDVATGRKIRPMEVRVKSYYYPYAGLTLEQVRSAEIRQWGDVTCLAFSPNGRTLLSGCRRGDIHICDVATGKDKGVLIGHMDTVVGVWVLPDNRTVISSGRDFTVRAWDLERRQAGLVTKWGDMIESMAVSVDYRIALFGAQWGFVRLTSVDRLLGQKSGDR